MRRLSLLAAVAAVLGVLVSSATGGTGDKPHLAAAAKPETVATPAFVLRKVGEPRVTKVSRGWKISVRFTATAAARAVVRVTRDARPVQTFRFAVRTGIVTVGPLRVESPGAYRFVLDATSASGLTRSLAWTACLACGALRPPVPPLRSLGPAHVTRSAKGWKATVSFETETGGTATIRLLGRGGTLTTYTFRPRAGRVDVGPFTVSKPGRYALILRLIDPRGRTRTLTWTVRAR
jgi:hypothetical protein